VGAPIVFSGSASSGTSGNPLTFQWDFGDGNTATGVAPVHSYAAAGQYSVTLIVDDGYEPSLPATATAIVTLPPTITTIAASPLTIEETEVSQLQVAANDPDDGPNPITFTWTVLGGQGSVDDPTSPTPVYSPPVISGSTVVAVSVKVSDGVASVTDTVNITVQDTVEPAPISDLTVSSADFNSATLSWIASGDDGTSGTASGYDLRYSTKPIDATNFDSATTVASLPAPGPAGTMESVTVPGLSPGQEYYFALKVLDNVGNASLISNVASTTTASVDIAFLDDFESGDGNWTIAGTLGPSGVPLWHLSTHRAASPATGFYYGIDGVFNYAYGSNSGTITSIFF
jgi:PKD repeat protein